MSYIDELFKSYGCSVTKSFNTYQIKLPKSNIDTSLRWGGGVFNKAFWDANKSKIMSILLNGLAFDETIEYDEESLLNFINTYYFVLSPAEKLNVILEQLSNLTLYDGQPVKMPTPSLTVLLKLYFYNVSEWTFYLKNALAEKLIVKEVYTDLNANIYDRYSLTIPGLSRMIQSREIRASRFCFVAMSFTDDMYAVYQKAIEPALRESGFTPYIVSEDNRIESDKTINDAILAGIKKSRFTIADFTHHKDGVYFEAGYALGRGQKVIYTCREDHMGGAHFDINHYQHILWKDASDFKEKLIFKIEAFIKD